MGTRSERSALDTDAPVVFDTDVLIDCFRGEARARAFLEGVPYSRRVLPAPTAMELVSGARNRNELRRILRFVDGSFARLAQVSEEISRRAVALVERHALSHGLRPIDALIAATALTLRGRLATGNVSHFRFVHGLALLPPRAR